jgi:hypothetical protein
MPQLDTVSFFSQYFWFTVVFLSFYLSIVKFVVPPMSRLLKVRQAKTGSTQDETNPVVTEQTEAQVAMDTLIVKGVQASKTQMQQRFERSQAWLTATQSEAASSHFAGANEAYLHAFARSRFTHHLGLAQLEVVLPPISRAKPLVSHLVIESLKG